MPSSSNPAKLSSISISLIDRNGEPGPVVAGAVSLRCMGGGAGGLGLLDMRAGTADGRDGPGAPSGVNSGLLSRLFTLNFACPGYQLNT
jgi:hypothetical protein